LITSSPAPAWTTSLPPPLVDVVAAVVGREVHVEPGLQRRPAGEAGEVVVQRQVMLTLGRLQEGLHAAVVLIGHDMGLVAQFADTIGVLYARAACRIGAGRRHS